MANSQGGGVLRCGVTDASQVVGTRLDIAWLRRRGLADPLYTQLASSVRLVLLAADALPPDVLNELTPSARAILGVLRLADRPLGTGQLAELAGISRMTATRALAQLRDREIVGWQGESAKDPRATRRSDEPSAD